MPRENIGTAYVRILADGSGLDRSIREQFKEHDKVFGDEGEKNAQAWRKGWEEELKRAPNQRNVREALAKPLSRGKWLEKDFFSGQNWREFQNGLERRFGEAGTRAADNLRLKVHEGMDLGKLQARMEMILPDIAAAQREIDREWLAGFQKDLDDADAMMKQYNDEQRARLDEAYRMNQQYDRKRRRQITSAKKDYTDLSDVIRRLLSGDKDFNADDTMHRIEKLRLEMGRLDLLTPSVVDHFRDSERAIRRLSPRLDGAIRGFDKFGLLMKKSFGGESQNMFLRFTGGIAGAFGAIPSALTKGIRGIKTWTVGVREAFKEGEGLKKLLTDFGRVVLTAGAGLGGMFFVLGPLVSLFSELAGAVVALASSLSFGLVGALGAVGGAALPAAAGIAALVLGLKNLDGEAKKSAKGIVTEFKNLGKSAAEGLMFDRKQFEDNHNHTVHSFSEVLNRIRGMVSRLNPVMKEVGRGMADAMDIFTERVGGAGNAWDKFIKAMTGNKKDLGWLGIESKKVGRIFGEAFGGLLGTLRSLMPLTNRFLTWLRDLTVRYDDWINSKDGQKTMIDFFDRAGDSAAQLGDFLLAAGKLLGTLLDAGKNSGDSLFGSMTDKLNDWNDALKTDGGRDALKQWFKDAKKFAEDLGNILVDLGDALGTLDSEASRSILNFFLSAIGDALKVINGVIGPVAKGFGALNTATHGISGELSAAALVFPRLNTAFSNGSGKISTFASNLKNAETRMGTLKSAARGAAGVAGLALLSEGAQTSNKKLGVLFDTLGGAATGFALGGPIGALIGGASGGLLGIVNAAKQANTAAKNMKANWSGLKETLDEVTGATTAATQAYIYDELQRKGLFETLDREGVARRTVVNAVMGDKSANEKLNGILQDQQNHVQQLTQHLIDLKNKRDAAAAVGGAGYGAANRTGAIDKEIDATQTQIDKENDFINSLRDGVSTLQENTKEVRERSKAITDLSALVGKIPEKKLTKIEAQGIYPTERGIARVADKYNLLPRQIKSIINTLGVDTSVKGVQKVIDRMRKAATIRVNPKLGLDDKVFHLKSGQVFKRLYLMDQQKTNPSVTLDDKPARSSAAALKELLLDLPGMPKPATAKVDADPKPANDKIKDTTDRLHTYVNGNYTAKIKADASAANLTINDLNSRLFGIKDQTVYVDVYTRNHGKAGGMASGGLVNYAQRRLIGEAGPEAVVPLNRPLGQVDPAVRWLSAIAQGKGAMASGGVVGGGRTVDVGGITVVSPSADPKAVAVQTLNQLIAAVI